MSRDRELQAAIDAVRAASRVCRTVQSRLITDDTLQKKDKSPVTVADFASQAIICAQLSAIFPRDRFVGEENARDLRGSERQVIRHTVAEHVRSEMGASVEEARVLAWIDLGAADASGERYWTLDPIDGTKGYLRKEQYAVALALIEEGEVVLGVLGCPNLPGAAGAPDGVLFAAVRGTRSRQLSLDDGSDRGREITVATPASPADARFCESVESGHSDQDESARIAERLGITAEPYRIDSQCKYATVARGDASIYLRMPTRKDYQEKIWDHAAGKIVVECAGGTVTDIAGRPLDFTAGRTLGRNRGVVATSGEIHGAVIDAIGRVRDASGDSG
jgi:3'(2'), 5'-bisphosphate nucleotidase